MTQPRPSQHERTATRLRDALLAVQAAARVPILMTNRTRCALCGELAGHGTDCPMPLVDAALADPI